MNNYLEQLATRSLESMPLQVRPRLLSRFEPIADLHSEVEGSDMPTPSALTQIEQLEREPMMHEVGQQGIGDVKAIVPRIHHEPSAPFEDRSGDLARRLDQLDEQFAQLSLRPQNVQHPPAGPMPTLNLDPPVGNQIETHLHYHNSDQHVHHVEVKQISPASDEAQAQQPAPPQIAAEPIRAHRKATEPTEVVAGESRRKAPPSIPLGRLPSGRAEWSAASPSPQQMPFANRATSVPTIVVEKEPPAETSHTVTVSIGRIEVRAPRNPVATVERSKRPAPRIMTLDDYMRRRMGGAG